MFTTAIGKSLVVASAIAGLAFIAAPSPSKAASAVYCADYARAVANDRAPRRGLVGGVLALPFDVTGAVLTGRTTYDTRWERAYDRAYANCRAGSHVVLVTPRTQAFAVAPAIEPEEDSGSCNFSEYHSSYDPTRC